MTTETQQGLVILLPAGLSPRADIPDELLILMAVEVFFLAQ
jgi:hypothetical protein